MNRRIKKKKARASRVSKEIIRLVRKYTSLHSRYDMCGDICSYQIIGYTEVSGEINMEDMRRVDIMPKRQLRKIHDLCKKLYLATEKITNSNWYDEYLNGDVEHHCNYRVTKKKYGDYVSGFNEDGEEIKGYWVSQRTVFEDWYEGTVYLPLNNGKYLAYDYKC